TRKGHRSGDRRPGARNPLRPADLPPALVVVLCKREQRLERRLLQAVPGRYTPHVIDDERYRKLAQEIAVAWQIHRVEMQVHVPTQRLDALDHAVELTHVGDPAQMLHEIESYAPKARLMKLFEHPAGKRIVGVGYAAVSTTALRDGIDDHGVVRTVTACVHEHRALEAEDRLQLPEPGERRIR